MVLRPAGTDQEEVARLMARYDPSTLPVVDSQGVLIGVITIDDVIDVIEEETTETSSWRRASRSTGPTWNQASRTVVQAYRLAPAAVSDRDADRQRAAPLRGRDGVGGVAGLFIPPLIGTGGNAGSQTTSTIIRALAVEDLDRRGCGGR